MFSSTSWFSGSPSRGAPPSCEIARSSPARPSSSRIPTHTPRWRTSSGCPASLRLASLLTLGRRFGIRPAMRGLATRGPYRVVRHPMYLAYLLSDTGYNLQEWNIGTVLLVMLGWASLLYRIHAEERILSKHADWPAYVALVRYRLLPGFW